MKPERWILVVCAALLLARATPALAGAPKLDAPTGLTLRAQEGGRYQLLWDPIYRDDLMGYSVWLRRPGEREFTRLSVPVKVGKEVRRMPMISEARLTLALGAGRREVEVAVVAEYEDGPSERSPSAYSLRAAAVASAPGNSPTPPLSVVDGVSPTVEAEADGEEGRAWPKKIGLSERPLLTPFGAWRTEWGVGIEVQRSIRKGNDPFYTLGLLGTGIDPEKRVEWLRVDMRTVFSAPLTLRWGLLPGFEVWGRAAYHAEDLSVDAYDIDGQSFGFVVPVRITEDDEIIVLSNPTSAGLGDIQVGVRVQPLPAMPLLIGAQASLPTGRSYFASYLDWDVGRGAPAGTGEGVLRMEFNAALGEAGVQPGLSLNAGFSPGITERVQQTYAGIGYEHVLTRGDRFELGGAYTFPWELGGRDGALMLGVTLRSIDPARWRVEGIEIAPLMSPVEQSSFNAHTQTRFVRDDQLELSIEALQDLPAGVRTGGRLSYVNGVQGDALRLSGQFYY